MRRASVSRRNRASAALALSLLAVLVGGCGHKREEAVAEKAPQAVVTVTARSTTTEVAAEVPGVVRPLFEARLAPKIMSKVAAVLVREGDRVRRGQVLVRLENRDLAAGVAQGAAAVTAARAGEQQARTALQMQRVAGSVEVRQAEAALQSARASLARVRQGPRPEQRQQAEQAVANARAGLESARARLAMLREGARKQERAQAAGGVARAEQATEAAHQGVVAAEAAVRTAEADYTRVKNLVTQDVLPRQQLTICRWDATSMKWCAWWTRFSILRNTARFVRPAGTTAMPE